MYWYAFAIAALIAAVVFMVLILKNYKRSQNQEITSEERKIFERKMKNSLFFFILCAVVFEIAIFVAHKLVS